MQKPLIFLWIFITSITFSQTREIDSLKLRLKNTTLSDTVRVIDLNELAWQYLDYDTDSAHKYVQEAVKLSETLNYGNGLADSKNIQGILYRYAGDYNKAIKLYEEIIVLRRQQERFDKLTGAYANLGSVYLEKSDNAKALAFYKKAYENATELKQSENQLVLLNNMGAAYKASGLYELAVDAFNKGLNLNKAFKDEIQEAQLYLNIATVYDQDGRYEEAMQYERQAYNIFKKLGSTRQLSVVLNNLSLTARHVKDYKSTEAILKEMKVIADELKDNNYYVLYHQSKANYLIDLKRFSEASQEIDRALELGDSIGDRPTYGVSLLIKSNVLSSLKDYAKAMQYCDRGIFIMRDVDDKRHLIAAYAAKSEIYQGMGDYRSALTYYKQGDRLLDSLSNEDYRTKMATLNSLNELDKKEKELQLSISEKESVEAKNKQQSFFLLGSIVISLLVLVLLIFSIRAYRVKKKDNELLNSQKKEIEVKNRALHVRGVELEAQKMLVEEKQKEILDSIHYAKRIQQALLANHELINRNLSENFILFKPKDIVSGDFYWATERDDCFYLAVCDSTGHGVPGAFMSLLNISFLNEAINEKNIATPNEVLNHVRKKLIGNISQGGTKDGMDCILLCFDKKKNSLTYAAAHNKPLLVNDNVLTELPADKMPVGQGENLNSFTLHNIPLKKGSTLYLYSDGYADQFGGPDGKKFKYKALQAILLRNSNLPLEEQKTNLARAFDNWKGGLEQVDDVVLVGIRL
ncbi:MAG: tetratricopeptide repeat protein [Bacteroidia bacterium]|nr:tetratricopeptide repeat protein [Bacteroidia bacterium]